MLVPILHLGLMCMCLYVGAERPGVQFVEEVHPPSSGDLTEPALDVGVSSLIGQTLV